MVKYDVYKNNVLLGEGLKKKEAIAIINISNNAFDCNLPVVHNDNELINIKGHQVRRYEVDANYISERFPPKLMAEWDRMTLAAELIRQEQGKIVETIINGKLEKVTVPRGR